MWDALSVVGLIAFVGMAWLIRFTLRWRNGRLPMWMAAIMAGMILVGAIHEYGELSRMEEEGGTVLVGRSTKLLYGIGGKNLVMVGSIILVLFIIAAMAYTVKGWLDEKRVRAQMEGPIADLYSGKPFPKASAAPPARPRLAQVPLPEVPAPAPPPPPAVAAPAPGDGPRFLK